MDTVGTYENLAKKIISLCEAHVSEGDIINANAEKLEDKYGVPLAYGIELFSLKRLLENEDHKILFWMLDILNSSALNRYFDDSHIKELSSLRYEIPKLKATLDFPDTIQIAPDQWLTKISVKRLMEFRDAQIIRYNENMQRTMKKVKKGNIEYYKIFVNKKALEAIIDSYNKGIYIPNTLTFNMGETSEKHYEIKDHSLQISSLENGCFNILDGYHRYLALSNIHNVNKDFDIEMELRITMFNLNKARQFIWQEDQKTKMKKIDSDSLNQQAYNNKIVSDLNRDSYLSGQIIPNGGIINSPVLSRCIKISYDKLNNVGEMLRIKDQLIDNISTMLGKDANLTENAWSENLIIAFTIISAKEKTFDYNKVIELSGIIKGITGSTIDNKIRRCIRAYREEM